MSKLEKYQKYQTYYELILVWILIFINNTVLAISIILDDLRVTSIENYQLWRPFALEYTSGFIIFLLVPGIVFLLKKFPYSRYSVVKIIVIYFIGAITFSVVHVTGMIVLREVIWWFMGVNYNFGELKYGFLYEFQKDIWSFITLIILILGYQFILKRLIGEASIIEQVDENAQTMSDKLLVKKLGSEYIINIKDIEWLEASGNYVNLHINNRTYPYRTTLSGLIKKIEKIGFLRVHRSYAVNIEHISSITSQAGGDSEIKLKNGKQIHFSRRYKDNLKNLKQALKS